MHDAKTPLSRLVERAASGETIMIARAGRPVARLTALERPEEHARLGGLEGQAEELGVSGDHAIAAGALPAIHGDLFDRMLVAQARVAGAVLLTADPRVADYGSPVRVVG